MVYLVSQSRSGGMGKKLMGDPPTKMRDEPSKPDSAPNRPSKPTPPDAPTKPSPDLPSKPDTPSRPDIGKEPKKPDTLKKPKPMSEGKADKQLPSGPFAGGRKDRSQARNLRRFGKKEGGDVPDKKGSHQYNPMASFERKNATEKFSKKEERSMKQREVSKQRARGKKK